MQIKFISLGLLAAVVAYVVADTVKVTDTDVKLHNTGSCILNNLKVKNVLNKLHTDVASKKRSVVSRRKVADEEEADGNDKAAAKDDKKDTQQKVEKRLTTDSIPNTVSKFDSPV